MAKPNIKRIAELAGVSTTTVSYVLNHKPGISEETRNRVLRIIEQENYTPNGQAQHAALKRTYNIYLVLDAMNAVENLFYSAVLEELVVVAEKYNYNIIMTNKFEAFQSSMAATSIKQNSANGLIFFHDIDTETMVFLRQAQMPYVVVDSHLRNATYSRVRVDYIAAAYTVTKHLIDQGHREIGFIGATYLPPFYLSTFQGYCRAMAEHDLSLQPQWIQSDANDFEMAYECMEKILHCKHLPTAIVCAADLYAMASMNCIQSHGYRVPQDISVVGIDDLNVSKTFYPSLTTVHLDAYEIAEKAMELLDKQIATQNPNLSDLTFVRSDQLIVRSSTRPISR